MERAVHNETWRPGDSGAGGPAFRRARVIGERSHMIDIAVITVSLVCDLSPITHAAEGGTKPPAPWNPMDPMLKKTPGLPRLDSLDMAHYDHRHGFATVL